MKINNTEGKICTKCGEFKKFEEFGKYKGRKDGLQSKCKNCKKEYNKTYQEDNKDKVAKYKKKYYQTNKENISNERKEYYKANKEKIVEHRKEYYKSNKDKVSEYAKEYYKANKDIFFEKRKRYYQTQKGKDNFYKSAYKRRSYKHKVDFTPFERTKLLERDNWECQYCGIKVHDRSVGDWNTPDKAHIDHIIPMSKGGNSELSNLQILCRTCNLSKSNK